MLFSRVLRTGRGWVKPAKQNSRQRRGPVRYVELHKPSSLLPQSYPDSANTTVSETALPGTIRGLCCASGPLSVPAARMPGQEAAWPSCSQRKFSKPTRGSGMQRDATRVIGVCHQHQAMQGLWQEAVDAKSSHKTHARTQQEMDLIKLPDDLSLPPCSLFFALSTSSRQPPTEHELCLAWAKPPG